MARLPENFPVSYIKLSFGGGFAGTNEMWMSSINIGYSQNRIDSINDADAMARYIGSTFGDEIENALRAALVTGGAAGTLPPWNTAATLEWITLRGVDANGVTETDGRYWDGEAGWRRPILGAPSLAGPSQGPLQLACAVTFVSNRFTRNGRFNRCFIPASANTVVFTEAQRNNATSRFRTLLQTLFQLGSQNGVSLAWYPIILSGNLREYWETNSEYPLAAHVWTGSVPDTQRRRRNRLVETFAIADIDSGRGGFGGSSLQTINVAPIPGDMMYDYLDENDVVIASNYQPFPYVSGHYPTDEVHYPGEEDEEEEVPSYSIAIDNSDVVL